MSLFKNRYGEPRPWWSILAALALIVLGQFIAYGLVPEGKEDDVVVKILVTLAYSLIVIGGELLLFKLIYKRGLRQIGVIPEGCFPAFLHGLGIGAVSMALVFAVFLLSGHAVIVAVNINKLLSLRIIIEFISLVCFAFSEELFARGHFMTALKTTRNKWVILLVSSAIFSLLHLINPNMTVLPIVNMFIGGLLLAYMFFKSGKLWLPTGYHVAVNFFFFFIFGMTISGREPEASVLTTQLGANRLLFGGDLGPEGGLILTVVILMGLLYVYFFVKTPDGDVWTINSDLPFTRKGSTK
jgi:membrane protease YdiL (CAAX protease family)